MAIFRLFEQLNVQKYLFIIVFALYAHIAMAQRPVSYHIHTQEPTLILPISTQSTIDSLEIPRLLADIILMLNKQGFLAASLDSIYWQSDTMHVNLTEKNKYQWLKLDKGNVLQEAITASGYRSSDFEGKFFSPSVYTQRANRIIRYLEQNGYPFASLLLDSIVIDSQTISAIWNLQLNNFTVYDSIEVIGEANIKKWYLNKYLSLKIGAPYNEQTIKKIDSRINQLPYLSASKNAALYFYGDKAKPILFLNDRKANNFDGIIGFAPNNQLGQNTNNLLVTGEANLKLQNLFGSGKYLEVNFRSFLGNSQELRLRAAYPYILKSNIGFDYDLKLLKQDSTFLDVRNTVGIQYRFAGEDQIRFFYTVEQTTLITIDTNRILALRMLPEVSDLVNYQYGTSGKMLRYDYYINPRKGFGFDIMGSIGSKQIRRNAKIDALQLTNKDGASYGVYDSVPLRMIQYALKADADLFIPIIGNIVSRLQVMAGHIQAPRLFLSELYRIGGIRSLKGFDEQSFFASTYGIVNLEIRYLLQQNAHALIFWNGAYYENAAALNKMSDRPHGMGFGVNFETGTGIFSIYYAVGREQQNPIDIRKAKVHFGFINYF
jgi:hypothetical protein